MAGFELPTVAPAEELPVVPLYEGNLEADLRIVSRNRLAEKITGGRSSPGKMPCPSWGISAARCRVGAVLAEQAGTVCHACYARKRNYLRDSVQAKLEERYDGLFYEKDGVPLWTPAMVFLLRWFCNEYFRWMDSGDVPDPNFLKNVVTIARNVPDVKMWLPTREVDTVRSVLREIGAFPPSLIVRISTNKIDGKPSRGFKYTSSVVSDPQHASCVAQLQKNKCDGEVAYCRACWEDDHVSYPLH